MKQLSRAFLLLLTVFLSPLSIHYSHSQNSEDVWTANVERQLDRVSSNLRNVGFVKSDRTYVDSINQGYQQYIEVTLSAHTSYSFVGVCDQDCSDLDLYLKDDAGNLVDQDTDPDDTPTVSVTPKYTGVFRLYVSMARCSSGPCRWGVGIYLHS